MDMEGVPWQYHAIPGWGRKDIFIWVKNRNGKLNERGRENARFIYFWKAPFIILGIIYWIIWFFIDFTLTLLIFIFRFKEIHFCSSFFMLLRGESMESWGFCCYQRWTLFKICMALMFILNYLPLGGDSFIFLQITRWDPSLFSVHWNWAVRFAWVTSIERTALKKSITLKNRRKVLDLLRSLLVICI